MQSAPEELATINFMKMCPAAPPPESSSEPVKNAAVHSGVAAGVLAEVLGAAVGADDGVPSVLLAVAVALGLALEASGVGGVFCGPHAVNDAPMPRTASKASA